MTNVISADFPYQTHFIDVYGSKIHYIDEGQGDPILLLHGVPTSSYVWRNIIPYLSTLGRCIAPDLIGMGKSDKPSIEYTIFDHINYIEKFIESLNLKKLTIIMHGWGSIIGFHYAMHHQQNCRGLVFYEAYLRSTQGEDISLPMDEQLHMIAENDAYDLIMNSPYFIDEVLPQTMGRSLTAKELNYYREPFLKAGSGKPINQYLQEMSYTEGENTINQLIESYSNELVKCNLPKLMLYSVPGFITTIATAIWAKDHLPNLEIIEIGEDLHYAQETNPALMGEAISVWLQSIEKQTTT
jgi:haloalkane dehalogenase